MRNKYRSSRVRKTVLFRPRNEANYEAFDAAVHGDPVDVFVVDDAAFAMLLLMVVVMMIVFLFRIRSFLNILFRMGQTDRKPPRSPDPIAYRYSLHGIGPGTQLRN